MRFHRPLANAADAFMVFEGRPGFAMVAIDNVRLRVVVSWKGALPDDLRTAIRAQRARGVRVVVHETSWSAKDIDREIHRIIGTYGSRAHITGIGQGRSGIHVSVEPGWLEAARETISSEIPLTFDEMSPVRLLS